MSELATEYARLSAVSIKSTMKPMRGSIQSINNSMKSLGLIGDGEYAAINMITGALNIICGMATIAKLATAWREAKNVQEDAKAVALTTANTAIPGIGWGKIAMAAAGAAIVTGVLVVAVNTIKLGEFNLGTAEGRQAATDAAMGAIA